MVARPDSVCKFICETGNWQVTNLQLQKLLYVGQMAFLGMEGERLVDLHFEAWDYGPVAPQVYKQVRMFGKAPIQDVFPDARPFAASSKRREYLADVCRDLLAVPPGELVEITHWERGAWAAHYIPGVRGIKIPDEAIINECRARITAGHLQPN
ncbi:Panacea domain-containing protein [Acidisoma sp. 7E03]